jgi:4'-phosphopantetheinyl transferase
MGFRLAALNVHQRAVGHNHVKNSALPRSNSRIQKSLSMDVPMAGKESLILINPNEVHLWRTKTDLPEYDIPKLYAMLPEDEKDRADRFRFSRHRRRFIASHAMLRMILGKYLGREPAAPAFEYDERGKPRLAASFGPSGIFFNLSHSHDMALVGVAQNRRIGVDIEFIRPLSNMEATTRRYFSEIEAEMIADLPPDHREKNFFKFWTIKEAYLKATGDGLTGLRDINLPIHDAPREATRLTITDAENHPWSLRPLDVAPDYAAAFAVEGDALTMPIMQYFSFHEK